MTSAIAARALYESVCAVTAPPGVDYEKLPKGISLKVVQHEATPGSMPVDAILCFDHREGLAYPLEVAEAFLVHSHARQLRQLALDHGVPVPPSACAAAASSLLAPGVCGDDGAAGPSGAAAVDVPSGNDGPLMARRRHAAQIADKRTQASSGASGKTSPRVMPQRAPSERDAQRDFEETGF